MIEIAEVQKRVRQAIDRAKHAAVERRAGVDAARREYERFLEQVAAPVFRVLARTLKAEGYPFQVFTPASGPRLASEKSAEDFVELFLDTTNEPGVVVGRVSRSWGRKVMTREQPIREGARIEQLTDEDVLGFLLTQIEPFLER